MIKNPTIHDFPCMYTWDETYGWCCHCIRWEDIEKVLGKQKYKRFRKWMNGQTCVAEGAYRHDVENFLRPEKDQFFD